MEPEGNKKNVLTIIVVLVIALIGGYVLYTGGTETETGEQPSGGAVSTPEPTLAPQLQLTREERAGNVGDKKAGILQLVRSGKLLTPEQKSEIGGIMLTKAHIYNFTEEERQDLFEALQK